MELKIYTAPQIELVMLDNDISLQLVSNPPIVPGEVQLQMPDFFNNPYKDYNA